MTRVQDTAQPFVSYAQNLEDVVLWRVLGHIDGGTYVDVGAADPTEHSVTRAFYERGWSGVNIEPADHYADLLERDRPRDKTVRVVAGRQNGEAILNLVPGTGLSTLDPSLVEAIVARDFGVVEQTVAMRTLESILDDLLEPGQAIHFLKVDVEGAELEVFEGLSFERWRPWVVVAEATLQLSTMTNFAEWHALLERHDYEFCLFDGLNRFYIAAEHADLGQSMSYPACLRDEPFHQYRKLNLAVANLEQQVRAVEDANEQRRKAVESAQGTIAGIVQHLDHLDERSATARSAIADREAATAALTEQLESLDAETARIYAELDARRPEITELESMARSSIDAREANLQSAHALAAQRQNVVAEVDAMQKTVSWRVSRPLRWGSNTSPRPSSTTLGSPDSPSSASPPSAEPAPSSIDRESALEDVSSRVVDALRLVFGRDIGSVGAARPTATFAAFADALASSTDEPLATGWLCACLALGAYPSEAQARRMGRILELDGPAGVIDEMQRVAIEVDASRQSPVRHLVLPRGSVLIDVTHTSTTDIRTGIQRVVTETVRRWLIRPTACAVRFDAEHGRLEPLDASTLATFLGEEAAPSRSQRDSRLAVDTMLLPWRCTLLAPELFAEAPRSDAYRSLAASGVLRAFSLIAYDLVPATAAETVASGMAEGFAQYLSAVKHSTRVSAISEATARDLRGFLSALESQGLTAPAVSAHPLPIGDPPVATGTGIGPEEFTRLDAPRILVVGSHEPRKNHLRVLAAAELVWRRGVRFQILFIGGHGWESLEFSSEVTRLQSLGMPVFVRRAADEAALWAAYRSARFSVFASLSEGYGLPIAESLSAGTPVITSGFGSMAEVGASGALLIDPRSVKALADAMELLLTDDAELERLRAEAVLRQRDSWDDYAAAVWDHLVNDDESQSDDVVFTAP